MIFKTKKIDSKAILLSASAVISIMPYAKILAEKIEPVERPNIIFIMSDDHSYQAISAYKDRFENIAPTPNIDRIAHQGMRFDRCYVTNSISGPSRATDYLACIQSVDESVGEVLDYLKQSGLDKNTIVVYTSDQGFYLGEHGWFDKRFMFNESLRTPLLISWPGVTLPGIINNDMVSNLDFAETFLDAAGLKVPMDMQGVSMVPILKGKTPVDWRHEHYYEYFEFPGWHSVKRHYGITTDRYKLMHFYYDIDEWELYDLKTDPNEMRNVYNDPKYTKIRSDLHKRLIKLRIKYKDSNELMKSFLPVKNYQAL